MKCVLNASTPKNKTNFLCVFSKAASSHFRVKTRTEGFQSSKQSNHHVCCDSADLFHGDNNYVACITAVFLVQGHACVTVLVCTLNIGTSISTNTDNSELQIMAVFFVAVCLFVWTLRFAEKGVRFCMCSCFPAPASLCEYMHLNCLFVLWLIVDSCLGLEKRFIY